MSGYSVYPLTLAAGEVRKITVQGRYVRFLSSEKQVHLGIDDEATHPFPHGVGLDFPQGFTALFIHNPESVVVKVEVAVSNGHISDDRVTFSGGALPVSGSVAITNFPNNPAVQTVDQKAHVLGANIFNGFVNNGTIIDPASNTNGATLRSFYQGYGAGSSHLVMHTSAPSSGYGNHGVGVILHSFRATGEPGFLCDVTIPAGQGLYYRGSAQCTVSASYDLD